MGGPGSGREAQRPGKHVVEDIAVLDVRRLHRQWPLRPGNEFAITEGWCFPNHTEMRAAVSEDELILSYRWLSPPMDGNSAVEEAVNLFLRSLDEEPGGQEVEEVIPLAWTPCQYGGARPWFLCPGEGKKACGRRVAVLHPTRYQPLFLCRACADLVYSSRRRGETARLLGKARKIRRRLGGPLNTWQAPFPAKPKGMHWKTYERLAEIALEAEEKGLELLALQAGKIHDQTDRYLAASHRKDRRRDRRYGRN